MTFNPAKDQSIDPKIQDQILQAVQNIRFGSVEIIIQDSRVVQIETTEKIRVVKNQ